MWRFLLMTALLLLPAVTAAQDPCVFVPGGCPPANIVTTNLIPTIASIMMRLAGGLALIFIIIAGIQIVMSQGESGRIQTARNSMIYALVGLGFTMISQLIISFVATEAQNAPFSVNNADVELMAWIVRNLLLVFNVLMGIALFIAGTRMLFARGKEDEFSQGRTLMVWTIVAAILVNISHAVIQVVITSFS